MADCKVYKQAISCQPVTEKPCLCEAGIMFSAVCSCVSQSVCLSVQKKMKSCWIRNVMVYKNICYGLSCTIWWLHLGDIWHWPDCKSCFSISVFFGPTPHPLCERYRLNQAANTVTAIPLSWTLKQGRRRVSPRRTQRTPSELKLMVARRLCSRVTV